MFVVLSFPIQVRCAADCHTWHPLITPPPPPVGMVRSHAFLLDQVYVGSRGHFSTFAIATRLQYRTRSWRFPPRTAVILTRVSVVSVRTLACFHRRYPPSNGRHVMCLCPCVVYAYRWWPCKGQLREEHEHACALRDFPTTVVGKP